MDRRGVRRPRPPREARVPHPVPAASGHPAPRSVGPRAPETLRAAAFHGADAYVRGGSWSSGSLERLPSSSADVRPGSGSDRSHGRGHKFKSCIAHVVPLGIAAVLGSRAAGLMARIWRGIAAIRGHFDHVPGGQRSRASRRDPRQPVSEPATTGVNGHQGWRPRTDVAAGSPPQRAYHWLLTLPNPGHPCPLVGVRDEPPERVRHCGQVGPGPADTRSMRRSTWTAWPSPSDGRPLVARATPQTTTGSELRTCL